MNKAAFLDRDGVINKDIGYMWQKENFIWMPSAKETIKLLNHLNYKVIIITNQPQISMELCKEEDVINLHNWINIELKKESAHIDDFFYCPHQYTDNCDCRKPHPKMILEAIKKWNIDKKRSFLIGDIQTDIKAARSAGISGLKFNKKNLYTFLLNLILFKGDIK